MTVWIYHERQQAALCGQHALNNLLQRYQFDVEQLADIARNLDKQEFDIIIAASGRDSKDYRDRLNEGSGNVDASGNFSIEVLRAALIPNDLTLVSVAGEHVRDSEVDLTVRTGFILNRHNHWFTIRLVNDVFWKLDSMKERPERISHFALAAEVSAFLAAGYCVFTCLDAKGLNSGVLPPPPREDWELERGRPEFWWNEEDLKNGRGDSGRAKVDTWRNVGAGMRLDGGATGGRAEVVDVDAGVGEDAALQRALLASVAETTGARVVDRRTLEGMSEEEQMRLAIEASMASEGGVEEGGVEREEEEVVGEEPEDGAEGVVKLQLRLPNNKKTIRRFLLGDRVSKVYAFVKSKCDGRGKTLELRAGFPPKDIKEMIGMTIGDAGLAGESLNGRWI
ncbi:hypothetical protein TrCOL_g11055 [Triparma columacea]|uniref:ubiquitinyl hydrolase 1 n=1 Tax=Triparma columacea TaxID=722753 RepID=A0A9W7L8M7_9STRA|nr:hypothetical protein TrCOL_g11055 [Triparma columacea]